MVRRLPLSQIAPSPTRRASVICRRSMAILLPLIQTRRTRRSHRMPISANFGISVNIRAGTSCHGIAPTSYPLSRLSLTPSSSSVDRPVGPCPIGTTVTPATTTKPGCCLRRSSTPRFRTTHLTHSLCRGATRLRPTSKSLTLT
jgi:hypothetical protein